MFVKVAKKERSDKRFKEGNEVARLNKMVSDDKGL